MRSQRVGHDRATSLPLYLCQKLGVTSQFMCAICAFLVLCFHLSFIKITEQLVQARHAARLYGRHKDACDTAADGRGQSDTCSPCVVFSRAVVSHSATPWTAACQASLSFTISRSLLKLMSIESVMPSSQSRLVLCCPLRLLPSIFVPQA